MKKLAAFFCLVGLINVSFATDAIGYIGYMWAKNAEKPVVIQRLFKDKEDCDKKLVHIKKVTEETIKVPYEYECVPIFSK